MDVVKISEILNKAKLKILHILQPLLLWENETIQMF